MDEQADQEHVATADEDTDTAVDAAILDPSDSTTSTEALPDTDSRSVSSQVVIGLCLLVLAILQGVGSFTAWLVYTSGGQSLTYKGVVNWRGFGWMTLVLAVFIVVVIVTDLVQPSVALKAASAALFGASGVIAVYFAVQYVVFAPPGQPPTSVGWGLGLCIGADVVGLVLGALSALRAAPSAAG
ncbi:MAG TPA: hypothetical protein VMQ40_06520 [Acidimicrobiales bacterium]|nr:hypothetical protein [Acidimicrobiales bacterium]